MRFGSQPLEEIVGLIREGVQEIQLHMHTEWVDESVEPLLERKARIDAGSGGFWCFSVPAVAKRPITPTRSSPAACRKYRRPLG